MVHKLFEIVRPDRAFFGQKDAAQVAVLRKMVRDLDMDVRDRGLSHRARERWPGDEFAQCLSQRRSSGSRRWCCTAR